MRAGAGCMRLRSSLKPVWLQPFVRCFPQPGTENDYAMLLFGNPINHAIARAIKARGIKTMVAFENRVGKFDWEFLKKSEKAGSLTLCGVG